MFLIELWLDRASGICPGGLGEGGAAGCPLHGLRFSFSPNVAGYLIVRPPESGHGLLSFLCRMGTGISVARAASPDS